MTIIKTETVTFVWSVEHGRCYDCGAPAAFWLPSAYGEVDDKPRDETKRCAVCAANAAAEGEDVRRIDALNNTPEFHYIYNLDFEPKVGTLTDYAHDLRMAHEMDVQISRCLYTIDETCVGEPDIGPLLQEHEVTITSRPFDHHDWQTVYVTVYDEQVTYRVDGRA